MSGQHGHGQASAVAGLPPPPPGIEDRRALAAPGPGTPPHHWEPGPGAVRRLPRPRRVRLRDGTTAEVTHEYRWYLDRVEGCTRRQAVARLYDVLLHPQGWIRSGVYWRRTFDRGDADIWVRVIPQDTTVCGPGSAGCFSWGYEDRPVAEMGVESIGREGPWRVIVGMEVCGHGTFAMHDGYANHGDYAGSLGAWQSAAAFGFLPSQAEIDAARAWLAGTTPAVAIHGH